MIEDNMDWVARATRLRSVATRRRHFRLCHEAPSARDVSEFYTLGPHGSEVEGFRGKGADVYVKA
ncbi:MAG TPA: hypothetical protein VEL06_06505 [Haliangiales bacterium]|nr:hypothetical protein [Haliangiales bacterium]